MTRRRYIKLLMAAGVKRNIAYKSVLLAQYMKYSYQRFYDEVMSPVTGRWLE